MNEICGGCPQPARVKILVTSTATGEMAWLSFCTGHANRYINGIGSSHLVTIHQKVSLW